MGSLEGRNVLRFGEYSVPVLRCVPNPFSQEPLGFRVYGCRVEGTHYIYPELDEDTDLMRIKVDAGTGGYRPPWTPSTPKPQNSKTPSIMQSFSCLKMRRRFEHAVRVFQSLIHT